MRRSEQWVLLAGLALLASAAVCPIRLAAAQPAAQPAAQGVARPAGQGVVQVPAQPAMTVVVEPGEQPSRPAAQGAAQPAAQPAAPASQPPSLSAVQGVAQLGVRRAVRLWAPLAGEPASCTGLPAARAAVADFDGDGRSDISVWRPSDQTWWIRRSGDGGLWTAQFGKVGDRPVPADYDGDGRTDLAVYSPPTSTAAGMWTIRPSGGAPDYSVWLDGSEWAVPVPGYWDADRKADAGEFVVDGGKWYIHRSCEPGWLYEGDFGETGDQPVQRDYDGDGTFDQAIFSSPTESWGIRPSIGTSVEWRRFGYASDTRVPADYDGDGRADLAVVRAADPVGGGLTWFVQPSSWQGQGGGFWSTPFGMTSDRLVPADYDGDGKADLAVVRPWLDGTGLWIVRPSRGGGEWYVPFGMASDVPVPAAYLP